MRYLILVSLSEKITKPLAWGQEMLGDAIMDFSDGPLETASRRLLGLPGDAPDPSGFTFEPAEEHPRWGKLSKMVEVPETEQERNLRAWHLEGRRGRFVNALTHQVHHLGYTMKYRSPAGMITWPVERRLFWHEFGQAREIKWVAWHSSVEGETTAIDGRIELPSGRQMGFDISCVGDEVHWANEAWSRGDSAADRTESWGCRTAVLPTQVLTAALLRTALRAWYVSRFEWVQGHWSNVEGKLPEFIIDPYWEDDTCCRFSHMDEAEKQRALEGYAEAAAKANQLVIDLLSGDEPTKLYQRYHQQAILPELAEAVDDGMDVVEIPSD